MGREKDQILIDRRRDLGYGNVMSPVEIDTIISTASGIDYLGLKGDSWSCLFTILWAYGKRISEVVELRTTDIAVRGTDLAITFTIRKKSRKSKKGILIPEEKRKKPPRRTKRLTLSNPYAEMIKIYWEECKERGGLFLFPGMHTSTGHIHPKYVWDVIQKMKLGQPVWTHLFRHTLATELAQNDVGAWEMKTWFDWESINTADEYVSSAGLSTKKVSGRVW